MIFTENLKFEISKILWIVTFKRTETVYLHETKRFYQFSKGKHVATFKQSKK